MYGRGGGDGRGGGGGGGGRGWYYKQKYGGGGRSNRQYEAGDAGSSRPPEQQLEAADDHDDDQQAPPASASGRVQGDLQRLAQQLRQLDGKGYKAYRDVEGAWQCSSFLLMIDHVQGDPYAAPSRLRAQVQPGAAQFPAYLCSSRLRRTALADWLARRLAGEANRASAAAAAAGWHSAKGGDVAVDVPGQHVLERTAVQVSATGAVEARFTVCLPAQGRSIMGPFAAEIITQHLPRAIQASLLYPVLDGPSIWDHIRSVEDSQALRDALPGLGLVGFVADDSTLPRRSGASDLPMPASPGLVAFKSPDALAVEVQLPHRGSVHGMGIREGITLIAGGGFHGKSTLLQALEAAVYNKVPGDGRELVALVPDAVKVSAEDGRRVEGVDISLFINNLPGGTSTTAFRSDDASGSTSQAASIQEALEAGARVLLMDEDTCATNFMMRDARMAALVPSDKEPITPFSSRIASLRAARVSTVLVMGGSGDYFEAADTVIVMSGYLPSDQTAAAHRIAAQHAATLAAAGVPAESSAAGGTVAPWITPRIPQEVHRSTDPRGAKTHVRGLHHIQYGDQDVQLAAVEQLVDRSQTRAVADSLKWLQGRCGQQKTLMQLLTELEQAFDQQGLDVLAPYILPGNLARPRRYELAAALNRVRTLKVTQAQSVSLAI